MLLSLLFFCATFFPKNISSFVVEPLPPAPFIIALGIAQDGGYPQAGCEKECCKPAWADPSKRRFVTSLALADPQTKKWWLFEATPNFPEQLQLFSELTQHQYPELPNGIFLTHGHIGHYAGLMNLGREVMNTKALPVYAMPRMKSFLTNNGPWSQLVSLKNISLTDIQNDSAVHLSADLTIIPFLVPHRDEYTETVGFMIIHDQFKTIFIPDIDKWNIFKQDINEMVHQANLVFLDGTFYNGDELPERSMKDIPHPFIIESMQRFTSLSDSDKKKIRFIHFNHTNPLLQENSTEFQKVAAEGFGIAKQGEMVELK